MKIRLPIITHRAKLKIMKMKMIQKAQKQTIYSILNSQLHAKNITRGWNERKHKLIKSKAKENLQCGSYMAWRLSKM